MSQWNKTVGVAYAVVSSTTFGLIPLFTISLLALGVGSPTILCYRFLLATVAMAIVMLLTRRNFRLPMATMVVVAVLAILYATTAILLMESYKYIPSGITTTIHFLYPLAVTLTMAWLFKERISYIIYIAVLVSLVGVALLAWGSHTEGDFKRGVTYAMVTVVTYAAYIVGVMRSRAARVDSVVLTFYVLAFGALLFFLYALATEGIEALHSSSSWHDIIMLALVCTVLSDYTLVLAIKHIGSTRTSILGSMEPLTAVVVGVVYFGERVDVVSVVGLVLIISAVVMVIVQSKPQEEEKTKG
ncbi:MAG: DMT family transporter [Alistipes sp.]|nr:DMT family transporter [Alistipes sp.]